MDGKRVRGWLPPLEPAPRTRRRRLNENLNETVLALPQELGNQSIWENPAEQTLEAAIEEDTEPIIGEDTRALQPIQTNLMGIDWGGTGKEHGYDPVEESINDRETVGGELLDDVTGVMGEEQEKLGEEEREEESEAIFFPSNEEELLEPTIETHADIIQQTNDVIPLAAHTSIDPPPLAAPEKPADRDPVVVDGRNDEYFDHCGEEFHLAMMLFVTSADLSTTQYEALTEVLALATIETLKSLPKSIKTLQQRCRRGFPLMNLKGKLVDVDLKQIPPKRETPRSAYFFEPSEYCKIWLSSPTIRGSLHQGLGEFVDVASELWHGDAWMESVRSTSGCFAFIKEGITERNVPLLPSDCVRYTNLEGRTVIGRVKCVGMDKRKGRRHQASALINLLTPPSDLRAEWAPPDNSIDPFPEYEWVESDLPELILVEHSREIIPCANIHCRVWVHFTDYPAVEGLRLSLLPKPPTFCVHLIAYKSNNRYHIRTVHKRHRVLAELELNEMTRSYVIDNMISTTGQPPRISIPYSVFLDGFGLYRNAYYSLKGMYLTPSGLDKYERARLNNMCVLMIGPFGSHEQQNATCLEMDALAVGRGTILKLDSNEDVFVTSFPLLLTGDMPQQNQNSGAKIHKATYGCRSCFVADTERGNLSFKEQHHGRYRQHVKFIYDTAISLPTKIGREAALRRAGLSETGPFFGNCYRMMDPQRGTPNDPMHAELRLCKYFEEALLEGILSAEGLRAYLAAWNMVQVPYGWGQPQNPITHKGSMVFSEHGRIAIINPFVLMHMFTSDSWTYHPADVRGNHRLLRNARTSFIKPSVAKRVAEEFGADFTGGIVKTASLLAGCVTLTLQGEISTQERSQFTNVVLQARSNLQKIFRCAAGDQDGKKFKNYVTVPNIHLALHYQEDIQNYATARNSSTMTGEQNHKIFKLHAPHTNSKENDLQLMKATNTAQTITFLLADAFKVSAPNITAQLNNVVNKCPIMCSRFLGVKKEMITNEISAHTTGIDCDGSLFARAITGLPVAIKKISTADYTYDSDTRCNVYQTEYETELLEQVRVKMHYWRYFSAVPKGEDGHKATPFKIRENQIIKMSDDTYSFHYVRRIFTITVGTMMRVFFVVKPLEYDHNEAESAMAPVCYKVFRLDESQPEMTIGLRRIDCQMLHFVSKNEDKWWFNPYAPNFS